MIAVDTSTWIAFFQGNGGKDAEILDRALPDRQVLMPPVVSSTLLELPLIEIQPGYWQRANQLRAKVLAKHRKAHLANALIAQSCIDHRIPLLTRDQDFQAFAGAAGLDLRL